MILLVEGKEKITMLYMSQNIKVINSDHKKCLPSGAGI
jgi:hypothetical protein